MKVQKHLNRISIWPRVALINTTQILELDVTATNDISAVLVGEQMTLTCSSEASDAAPDIKWYKDSDTTPLADEADKYAVGTVTTTTSNDVMTSKSELQLLSAASGDAGDYKCQVDYADPILDDSSVDFGVTVLGETRI